MYKFLTKNGQLLAFGVGALLVIIFLVSAINGADGLETLAKGEEWKSNAFNAGLYAAIGLGILAALGMLVFGIIQVATNFRGSIKGIIGFAALLVILLVAMSSSGPCIPIEGIDLSERACRFVGGGVTTVLVLFGLAAIALIASEVRNFFK